MTKIQKIEIKEVDIPRIRAWEAIQPTLDMIDHPSINWPVYDAASFEPLDYNPNKFTFTAPDKQQKPKKQTPIQPVKAQIKDDDEDDIKIEPCPPEKPQFRQGDYRNDKRIERLLKYERSTNGSCDPIWEKVPFRESFIGTPEALISTAVIGVVAGGSALLAPLIKKLISEIFKKIKKKLTKKKDAT